MLIDIDSGKAIERIPHVTEFNALRSRLSKDEFDRMVERINELIDEAGAEIATAGWLPGSDWTETPFEPIYSVATPCTRCALPDVVHVSCRWPRRLRAPRPSTYGTGVCRGRSTWVSSRTVTPTAARRPTAPPSSSRARQARTQDEPTRLLLAVLVWISRPGAEQPLR